MARAGRVAVRVVGERRGGGRGQHGTAPPYPRATGVYASYPLGHRTNRGTPRDTRGRDERLGLVSPARDRGGRAEGARAGARRRAARGGAGRRAEGLRPV